MKVLFAPVPFLSSSSSPRMAIFLPERRRIRLSMDVHLMPVFDTFVLVRRLTNYGVSRLTFLLR